jgi:pilus assembly protein CpaF
VQEISGMEGSVITMQEIFSFQQKGLDAKGNVRGTFRFQGIRPKFIEKFKMAGVHLPLEIFDPERGVEV